MDGGTNRWYQLIKTGDPIFNTACHPTLVTGDMDSVDKGLLKRIQANGCTKIVYTPDQNETDFTKAIREIETYTSSLGEEVFRVKF